MGGRKDKREREMWWERKVYTLCGIVLLAAILYLNFGGGDPTIVKFPIPWLQPRMGFVRRNGTHFVVMDDVDGGKNSSLTSSPLYVNGWNSYWLLAESSSGEKSKVSEMLRKGKEMGMEVCRTWAFSDGGPNALLISPGRFDENVFQALDYVIYEARRNGVRLILSLVNNLRAFGGKAQYVKWAIESGVDVSSSGDSFFEDSTIKGYYKDYVKAILTRKNSYSGVRYYDEPAIFAWELMNEPRCASNSSAPLLQAWILEMSSYVKSLDKKHLVTIGLEGFYGSERPEKLMANPGAWAASVGSDFIQNSAVEHIDFASVHAYPDSWIPDASLEDKVKYLSRWVDFHVNDSEHILKKPVLFTEIGSSLHTKKRGLYGDIFLKVIYDKIYESARKEQAGAGAFIWQLLVEGANRYGDEFSLVASEHPSTSKLIMQQSCRLHYMLRNGETNRTIEWPCIGVKF